MNTFDQNNQYPQRERDWDAERPYDFTVPYTGSAWLWLKTVAIRHAAERVRQNHMIWVQAARGDFGPVSPPVLKNLRDWARDELVKARRAHPKLTPDSVYDAAERSWQWGNEPLDPNKYIMDDGYSLCGMADHDCDRRTAAATEAWSMLRAYAVMKRYPHWRTRLLNWLDVQGPHYNGPIDTLFYERSWGVDMCMPEDVFDLPEDDPED